MRTEYLPRTKIIADDGKILTNGEIYGKEIYLADGVSSYEFHEISEAEYEAILAEQEKDNIPPIF